jgi:hypothetical protein
MTMKQLGLFLVGATLCFLSPAHGWPQSKVYINVSNETIEKTLQGLELKFQKGDRKLKDRSIAYYDFKRGEQPYRLYNYQNDLWIESIFEKKLTLQDVNRWNASAKFSRAVLLEEKDRTSVSLEAQIDCLGGVTDAMIRQFVNRFDEETQKFVKSLPK